MYSYCFSFCAPFYEYNFQPAEDKKHRIPFLHPDNGHYHFAKQGVRGWSSSTCESENAGQRIKKHPKNVTILVIIIELGYLPPSWDAFNTSRIAQVLVTGPTRIPFLSDSGGCLTDTKFKIGVDVRKSQLLWLNGWTHYSPDCCNPISDRKTKGYY